MTARFSKWVIVACLLAGLGGVTLMAATAQAPEAQTTTHRGGEANLVLPDLSQVTFLGGIDGHTLLFSGIVVSALGLLFGLVIYSQLKNMAVHASMLEISELIYETCKTYLVQ